MTWDIKKLVKGEVPTLIQAEKGNELIDALNKLGKMTIEAGDQDLVEYNANGIAITYNKFGVGEFSGTIKLLDAEDISQMYVVTIEENLVVSATVESSEWEEKDIEICESGSAVTYTFLVKS
jgi:hypothetical protein